jgi:hypothetical protein
MVKIGQKYEALDVKNYVYSFDSSTKYFGA